MIIVTNNKIEVSLKMMEDNNMTKMTPMGAMFGIPNMALYGGLSWKRVQDVGNPDFDKIEEYFLSKI